MNDDMKGETSFSAGTLAIHYSNSLAHAVKVSAFGTKLNMPAHHGKLERAKPKVARKVCHPPNTRGELLPKKSSF